MKKQDFLSVVLIAVLALCSLNTRALESKQEITNALFSDSELSKILSTRPFESAQGHQAAKRMKELLTGNLQKFSDESIPLEARAAIAECLTGLTLMSVVSTPAFEKKLARPDQLISDCSGQLIPDTRLSFSSVTAGANPSLN